MSCSDILTVLREYKHQLLILAENDRQRKFLEDAFPRWYFNSNKVNMFPDQSIVIKDDLKYANTNKATRFNVSKFMHSAEALHKKSFKKFQSLGKTAKFSDSIGLSSYKIITPRQFGHLQDSYIGKSAEFYKTIDKLISIYEFVGINNMQLSLPPIFKGVELFGSPLNTHNQEYCSPFDIEKMFGSLGSFWDYTFHKSGIYLCNPPFDEIFINRMADKLLQDISATDHKVLIIITLPIWDTRSQKSLGVRDCGLELEGFTKILKSDFLKEHTILNKDEFPYWNYYTEEIVPVCWSHLIILTNLNPIFYKRNFSTDTFLKMWRGFTCI